MLWGGTYRTAPELASRGKNFRFVQSWTDWVRQLAGGGPGGDRLLPRGRGFGHSRL